MDQKTLTLRTHSQPHYRWLLARPQALVRGVERKGESLETLIRFPCARFDFAQCGQTCAGKQVNYISVKQATEAT